MPSISLVIFAAALFLSAGFVQNPTPDSSTSPHDNAQSSTNHVPAQQDHTEQNRRIRDSINDALSSDMVLNGSHVRAEVDDQNITLNGDVRTFEQHQRALQLVHSFGRWRNIVDKIQVK